MFGLLNNPLGCSPILMMPGEQLQSANGRTSQRFESN
jgi:hypothetical protein